MPVLPTGVGKSMIFTVFYSLRSPGNCHLMFYVLFLFEDFDLATKQSLAIDVSICSNHQELRSRLASLSARSRR